MYFVSLFALELILHVYVCLIKPKGLLKYKRIPNETYTKKNQEYFLEYYYVLQILHYYVVQSHRQV